MDTSNLKLYSLGIVVETKPEKTDVILVCPIEQFFIQKSGNIKEQQSLNQGKLKNTNDKGFDTELKSSNYLRAKWLPFGHSNRTTAPDVVASETVVLFKFGDIDEYYWTTIFREPGLRRLETVLYSYSNMKKGLEEFNEKTSYWMKVDTKNKIVQFHTADNDGEYTSYDISIDTKNGLFTLKDKKGNNFNLDSKTDSLNVSVNSSVNITAPIVSVKGNVNVSGNIFASGSIIDGSGNTPNHSH